MELATAGLADRAGDQFDQVVGNIAVREFQDRHKIAPDHLAPAPPDKDRFRVECEAGKIRLSNEPTTRLELGSFLRLPGNVLDLNEQISRDQFEADLLLDIQMANAQIDSALATAGITARQIDLVLAIGGSSLIPAIQQTLVDRFGHRVINVRNANSIIAEGAAIADALGMSPVLAASVAVELSDGTQHPVFKAGTLAKSGVCDASLNLFCTDNRDGVARLVVGLVDGFNRTFERKEVVTIPVSPRLPSPYNHERVTVNFHLDEDLILHVDARAATQMKGEHTEIVDLRFALAFPENS